jgi:metal-responsive CopG/Arc/MetJ family transcriptional regulator
VSVLAAVDAEADRRRTSRSELVREALAIAGEVSK